jgi:aldose 1-epimerase
MITSSETESDDRDIEIEHAGYGVRVSPTGASLRGFWQVMPDGSRREIVTSYSGHANKVGGQGDVLIPFPGRIKAGLYTFDGVERQLDCTDKEGPNAIHGFLRAIPWSITGSSSSSIQFGVDLDPNSHMGYPFSLDAEISYSVAESGLTCTYHICNTGDCAAPVAAGFHPYFTVGSGPVGSGLAGSGLAGSGLAGSGLAGSGLIDNWTLQVPFTDFLEFENLIPTGRVLLVDGTEFDFRAMRRIGSTQLNTCFINPVRDEDGRVRIRLTGSDGQSAVIWADSSLSFFVLYSGDPLPEPHRRRSLAIEPMTCGSDGFNHPEWGLIALEPGDTTSGTWGVSV